MGFPSETKSHQNRNFTINTETLNGLFFNLGNVSQVFTSILYFSNPSLMIFFKLKVRSVDFAENESPGYNDWTSVQDIITIQSLYPGLDIIQSRI